MNWTWIPQLFSDLLGRIVPGAALMVVSYLVAVRPTQAIVNLTGTLYEKLFTLGPALIFLLFSYLIGFIMGQLWILLLGKRAAITKAEVEATQGCHGQCLDEHNKLQTSLGMPPLALSTNDLPRTFVMHDHLRFVAGAEAQRLLKLRSEKRLCHVIVLGFTVLGLVNLAYLSTQAHFDRLVLEVLLIASIVSCWKRSLRLEKQFVNGTCIAWLSYASAKKLLSQTEATPSNKTRPGVEEPQHSGHEADDD